MRTRTKKERQEFVQRWNTIIPQALEIFEENIREELRNNPDFKKAKCNPKKWLALDNWDDKFEYIMNNDYWLARWSIYLMEQLIDEIYKDKAKNHFSLN